jgi:hypothetical protein
VISGIPGVNIARAAVARVDQGLGPALTLDECKEAVEHPTKGVSRADLVETIAYLAAQVVGYRNSVNQDAVLAMAQIEHVLSEYRRRQPDEAVA